MPPSLQGESRVRSPFRVGEWLVEPLVNRITRGDQIVALRPRAMAVLVCLADRAGQLATKQHIIDTVWSAEFVSDNALTHVVAEIRTALGDDPQKPTYVETIPRRGYRLIAAVDLEVTPPPDPNVETELGGPVARRRWVMWMTTAALLAVGASTTVWWTIITTTAPTTEQQKADGHELGIRADRIVVVPFENRTGDPGLDSIGLMAADWITQGLARAAITEVVPPTAARQAAARALEQNLPPPHVLTVARETGAGVVVTGSYYLLGDQLQIQVNLADAVVDEFLAAIEPENGTTGDPMELINRVRQRVLGAVAVHFDDPGFSSPSSRPPLFEAYQEFTAGLSIMGRDYDKAVAHFESAAEIDPDFTAPRLWMFVCSLRFARWQRAQEILEGLEDDLDRLPPYEHLWVEWGLAILESRHLAALQVLQQIRRLTPNDTFLLSALASQGVRANRPREVIDALARIDLEEFIEDGGRERVAANFVFRLTSAYHMLGNHEEELAVARRGAELMPHRVWMHTDVLIALAALGAVDEMERVVGLCLSLQDPAVPSGWALVEAAEELLAHGHRVAGLRMAERALTWYRARPPEEASTEASRHGLGMALYLCERWSEAQEVYSALAVDYPGETRLTGVGWTTSYPGFVGSAAARQGDRDGALAALVRLEACRHPRGFCVYYRARIEALLGNRDRALQLLREAFAQGVVYGVRTHRDPDFAGLRGYPPFEELIRPRR